MSLLMEMNLLSMLITLNIGWLFLIFCFLPRIIILKMTIANFTFLGYINGKIIKNAFVEIDGLVRLWGN